MSSTTTSRVRYTTYKNRSSKLDLSQGLVLPSLHSRPHLRALHKPPLVPSSCSNRAFVALCQPSVVSSSCSSHQYRLHCSAAATISTAASSQPTGMLVDSAMKLVTSHILEDSVNDWREAWSCLVESTKRSSSSLLCFWVPHSTMSSSQDCSKNDRKRSSNWETSSTFDSAASYNREFEGMPPYCACGGVRVVLRTARTQEHYGLRFWGCRFYKKDVKDSGCNFFDWYKDDVVREKEMTIMKQKIEMDSIQTDLDSIKKDLESFQKDLELSKRWIKILVVICVGLFVYASNKGSM
ncbi:hypothetical protein RIF29_21191 [Crotalaria pallida]|uniref:GRF-type domain-containing protein n=1 Tax=Crotalaria pallida TaxID=3830 RepID=A0AAN9I701_CROPI